MGKSTVNFHYISDHCFHTFQICINAWLWSVVFHARDTPWTERMDYFSAFSMVLFSLFGLLVRYGISIRHVLSVVRFIHFIDCDCIGKITSAYCVF